MLSTGLQVSQWKTAYAEYWATGKLVENFSALFARHNYISFYIHRPIVEQFRRCFVLKYVDVTVGTSFIQKVLSTEYKQHH
jgi:hypothetical protein